MTWSGFSEGGQGSQERGPGTFALEVPGMPRARAAPTATDPVQVGISGGNARVEGSNANRASDVAVRGAQLEIPVALPKEDPAIDALLKVGGAQADRLIKEAEREQYIAGAARAASGQAMVEIANDQPWYSKLFGDTAVVEGARAYSVKERVSTWMTQHMEAMPQLAERPPGEIPAYLSGAMGSVMTGDPMTDQALTGELLAQVPVLVREHTKQHVKLLQERADAARDSALDAGFKSYGAMQDGALDMTVDDEARIRGNVQSLLVPPEGVRIERHWDRVVDRAASAVAAGNTHVYRLLADEGVLERMPLDAQLKIGTALKKAAPGAMSKFMGRPEIMERVINMSTEPRTREELLAEFDELNNIAEATTGVPQELAQLFDPGEKLRGTLSAETQRKSLDAATQKATMELVQRQQAAVLLDTFDPVRLQYAESTFAITAKEWQSTAADKLAQMPPEQRPAWISRWADAGKKFDAAEAYVNAEMSAINGPSLDPVRAAGFMQAYKALTPAARATYLTADQDRELAAVSSAFSATGNIEAAVAGRHLYAKVLKDQIKPDDVKGSVGAAVREAVDKQFDSGVFSRFLGLTSTDFTDTDLRYTEGLVMHYANSRGGVALDPNVRASAALSAALNDGALTLVGRRPVFNLDPKDAIARPISGAVMGAGPEINSLLEGELDRKAVASGMDNDNRMVMRLSSKAGQPIVYQIIGWDKDGKERYAYVTSDDVERAKVNMDSQVKATRAGTSLTSDGQAAAEARAAGTRAIQQRMK